MMRFIKQNHILSICSVISLIIILLYLNSFGKPEWFPYAGEWFSALCQLALGFEINLIFYITQVYIPRKNQELQARRCICARLTDIITYMRDIVFVLGHKYDNCFDEQNITDQTLFKILCKIKTDDRIQKINPIRSYSPVVQDGDYYTVKEWIINRVEFVEDGIDKLFKYYAPYINPELMTILESILKSYMHTGLARSLLQLPTSLSFEEYHNDNLLKPYYDYTKDLERIRDEYNNY